jgi:hypothetical protein
MRAQHVLEILHRNVPEATAVGVEQAGEVVIAIVTQQSTAVRYIGARLQLGRPSAATLERRSSSGTLLPRRWSALKRRR